MLKYLYDNYTTIKVDLLNKNNITFESFIEKDFLEKDFKLKSIRLIQIVNYSKIFNNSKIVFSKDFKNENIIHIGNFFKIKKNCNIYIPKQDFFLYFLKGKFFQELRNITFKFVDENNKDIQDCDIDIIMEFLITFEKI